MHVIAGGLGITGALVMGRSFHVVLTNNRLHDHSNKVVNRTALSFVSRFHLSFNVLKVDNVSDSNSLLRFSCRRIHAGHTVVRGSHRIVLIISRSGFNHGTVIGVNDVDVISTICASAVPPTDIVRILGSRRVRLRLY